MATAAILKTTKIAQSQQQIDRSSRNLARLCKMGHLTAQNVKKLNFQNNRWRTPAILKTVKSPHLRNRLTDFDEIWHGDADWPPTGDRPLKVEFFKTKMAAAAILKITTAISPERFDRSLRNLARLCKLCLLTVLAVKNLNFQNPRRRTAAILKKNP